MVPSFFSETYFAPTYFPNGSDAVVVPVVATPTLGDITQAFCSDMGPIKLLAHERRQLARIAAIIKRDRNVAKSAYILLKKRAIAMRAALRRSA